MRSLYWKIFLSFWLATILIILTTAWVTSEIAQKSSIPAREKIFMDSYATAAIVTFEAGERSVLKKWLQQTGQDKKMTFYLLSSSGEIISPVPPTEEIRKISQDLNNSVLDEGILKFGNLIISHEVISTSGKTYRLAAVSETPLSHFVVIPWAGLTIRLIIAIVISGLICYLLSLYLTQPLRLLSLAAKSIGRGKLNTRVGVFKGHYRDEIANLSADFDRMAEELETLIHSKERLLQDISHELRSPLARLHIAIELGRKKTLGKAEVEFNRMEKECLQLNSLIEEILQFARLEHSTEEIIKLPLSLKELIKKIVEDANFESGIARVKFYATSDGIIAMNENLMRSAIENIIRNALHYAPTDTDIHVSLTQKAQQLHITIEDEGIGVPPDQLEKIFSPFYRVDTSREKKTGGYGLGLAIARKAIFLHQGAICATNKLTGGLLIEIILPC